MRSTFRRSTRSSTACSLSASTHRPAGSPATNRRTGPARPRSSEYNLRVRAELDPLLEKVPEQLLHVAIEHRLMHAETFAYILHHLAYERKAALEATPEPEVSVPAPRMVEIPGGTARLGRTVSEGFGWDNEFEAHTAPVPQFAIGKYKVTNRRVSRIRATGRGAAILLGRARRPVALSRHVRGGSPAAGLPGVRYLPRGRGLRAMARQIDCPLSRSFIARPARRRCPAISISAIGIPIAGDAPTSRNGTGLSS